MKDLEIIEVKGDQSITDCKELLLQYGDYMFEELKLTDGKESFYNDLKVFPDEKFKRPSGIFYVGYLDRVPVACIGLKKFETESAEIKRMFVKQEFQGLGIGSLLNKTIINAAEKLGYKRLLLDTNSEMENAVALYEKKGFKRISAYCKNENQNPIYFEYIIKNS